MKHLNCSWRPLCLHSEPLANPTIRSLITIHAQGKSFFRVHLPRPQALIQEAIEIFKPHRLLSELSPWRSTSTSVAVCEILLAILENHAKIIDYLGAYQTFGSDAKCIEATHMIERKRKGKVFCQVRKHSYILRLLWVIMATLTVILVEAAILEPSALLSIPV
jgi:hypothetical protein